MLMRAALLGLALAGAAQAAEPDLLTVTLGTAAPVVLSAAELAALPTVSVTVAFGTEHGPRQAQFAGPLLWTVLDHAHAVDPAKPGGQVRQTILLTGLDGYTATLALGEIAPAFEGKMVVVAETMDGKPLEHPRIVVPGDQRGGRSVRDVARIAVLGPPG